MVERRSMQCAMGKKHEERTDCAVIQLDNENRTVEFGAGCHDEFLPSIRVLVFNCQKGIR